MRLVTKTVILIFVLLSICISINRYFLHIKAAEHSKPNIILIVIDALRPDHLSCYGYERNTSPNIDRLAEDGVRFSEAISAGGWTIDSVPSILTGTYSPVHQIRYWNDLKNPAIDTVAQLLEVKGYETVLWSNHGTLSYLDITKGFQRVYTKRRYIKDKPTLSDYNLTSNIINRLKIKYKNVPFFFYIHYEGCHAPYRPPVLYKHMYLNGQNNKEMVFIPISTSNSGDGRYNGSGEIPYIVAEDNITNPNYYIAQYDGTISYTDVQVGRLLDALKNLNLDKKTLIILTSDHGELLGEHNIYFNHEGCYDEVIRVPLIIRFPDLCYKNKVIFTQVSLVDIAPTILASLNIKKPFYMQGRNLLALMKSWQRYIAYYVLSFIRKSYALRSKDWKLYYNGELNSWEFYNLKNDPKEQYNLSDRNLSEFKKMRKILKNLILRMNSGIKNEKKHSLSNEDKEYLRSLGYAN